MSHNPFLSNLWQYTAGEDIENTALNEDQIVDAVIVGGGFTGITAALEMAQKGCRVTLLEANNIGHGGSGRNVGLINAGLWTEPEKIEKKLGQAAGEKINSLLAAGPDLVFANIEHFGIDCELTRTGTLHCAHSAIGLSNLKNRVRQYRARGMNVELLSAADTAAKTGTCAYQGAIWHHDVGTIQPLAYLRGLAQAAVSVGASVYQGSPAVSIERAGDHWLVHTSSHTVQSKSILLATNAYHQDLMINHAMPQYTPVYYFQAATRPLPEDVLERILPERQGCWDTATIMSSIRRDQAGRLIIGSVGNIEGMSRSVHYQWAKHRLQQMFPYIKDIDFEHVWHGRIAYSADNLPHIVKFGPKALSIFGYSGRGIGPGTVFGKAAAEYIMGGNEAVLPIAPSTTYRERFTAVKSRYYAFGATAMHEVERLIR